MVASIYATQQPSYNGNLLLLDDTATQSDTANGAIITTTSGAILTPYPAVTGGYPSGAATNGRIEGGKYKITPQSGDQGTIYWTFDAGAGRAIKYAQAEVHIAAGTAGGETISTMAFAIGLSNNLAELTRWMPVHIIFATNGFRAQHRSPPAYPFTTRSQLERNQAAGFSTTATVELHGDKLTVTFMGQTVTVQDAAFAAIDCRYIFFELQTTTNNTSRTISFSDPVVRLTPISAEPAYVAAVPSNIVSASAPFASGAAVAGNLYTKIQGFWISNNGGLTFTQQWQFNQVDIPAATATTYQTVNGVDEGKKIRVGEKATNTSGTAAAFAYSPESAALA